MTFELTLENTVPLPKFCLKLLTKKLSILIFTGKVASTLVRTTQILI